MHELPRQLLVGAAAFVGFGVLPAVPSGHGGVIGGLGYGPEQVVEAVTLLPTDDAGDLLAVVEGYHRVHGGGVDLGEGHAYEHGVVLLLLFPGVARVVFLPWPQRMFVSRTGNLAPTTSL